MLAEISTGFWGFWFGVGVVLYVVLAWTMIRVAVRWDRRRADERMPRTTHEGP